MRYLLELCKEKKIAHLRCTLLETQDLPKNASPSTSGKGRATRRTKEVGGYELSLRNSLRNASSANELGQSFRWTKRTASTAKLETTRETDLAKEKGG